MLRRFSSKNPRLRPSDTISVYRGKVVTDRDLCRTVIVEGLDQNGVKLKQCIV